MAFQFNFESIFTPSNIKPIHVCIVDDIVAKSFMLIRESKRPNIDSMDILQLMICPIVELFVLHFNQIR